MKLDEVKQLVSHLESQRTTREEVQKTIAEHIAPHRGKFNTDVYEGKKRNPHIINNAGQRSMLRAAGGLTSAMTPTMIPWFALGYEMPQQGEMMHARTYIDALDKIAALTLARGGFYKAIHEFNQDLLSFGCGLINNEQYGNKLRYSSIPTGSYALSLTEDKLVHTCVRRVVFTVKQLKDRFGEDKLSPQSSAKLVAQPYSPVNVFQFVTYRDNFDPEKLDNKNMPIASYFYEEQGEDFLSESGYTSMPFFFMAWNDTLDTYGTGLGDDCLDDQKAIDALESRKIIGLDKTIDPPMKTPTNYKKKFDTFAGAMNPMTQIEASMVTPLHEVSSFTHSLQYIQAEIEKLEMRIADNMYASVFADIALEHRPPNMTATEFAARRRDRVQMIEPSLSSYEPQILKPILERTLEVLQRNSMLPMPPENLGEQIFLELEFTSPLAQALKEVKASNTRIFMQDVAAVAQFKPEALDKVDFDQFIDEVGAATSVFPTVIRSDEEVADIRAKRAEQQQQQQEMQMLALAAQEAQKAEQSNQ